MKKNTFTICLNVSSKKNKGLTDNNYQKIILNILKKNKNINFCLLGLSNQEIISELVNLNLSNVINLIDKDKGIIDIVNIFSNSLCIISRNSGFIHLAGILNIKLIHLNWYSNGIQKLINIYRKNKIIVNNYRDLHDLYRKENWTPISINQIRLIEYNYSIKKNTFKLNSLLNNCIKLYLNSLQLIQQFN